MCMDTQCFILLHNLLVHMYRVQRVHRHTGPCGEVHLQAMHTGHNSLQWEVSWQMCKEDHKWTAEGGRISLHGRSTTPCLQSLDFQGEQCFPDKYSVGSWKAADFSCAIKTIQSITHYIQSGKADRQTQIHAHILPLYSCMSPVKCYKHRWNFTSIVKV